jgi:tetratricopeptide (TPR) repeat protein
MQRIGSKNDIGTIAINLADIQTRLNRPEAALPLLERAQEIFHQTDNKYIEAYILVTLARAEAQLGHSRSADALLDHADLIVERLAEPRSAAEILLIRGDLKVAAEAHETAMGYYANALSQAESADDQLLQAVISHRMGNAMAAVLDGEGARKNWRRALRMYGERRPVDRAALRELLGDSGAA